MNRILITGIALGVIFTGLQLEAGKAGGYIGTGIAGFALGRMTAPQDTVVQRETVYVQEPARTVTVQCPYLQRDLRNAQDQLAQERRTRASLEAEVSRLRSDIARIERHNDYLVHQNIKLEDQIRELQGSKVIVPAATTGHQCTAQSCQIKRTGTPGMNKPAPVDKEQY